MKSDSWKRRARLTVVILAVGLRARWEGWKVKVVVVHRGRRVYFRPMVQLGTSKGTFRGVIRLVQKVGHLAILPMMKFLSRGAIGIVGHPDLDTGVPNAFSDGERSVKLLAKR